MRGMMFAAVIVLILCAATFFYRQSPVVPTTGDASRFDSAINSARSVSTVQNAAARKRWAVTQGTTDPANEYSTEGDNSEILIITSASMDGSQCSSFAKSDRGATAAAAGFLSLKCKSRTNGFSYEEVLAK